MKKFLIILLSIVTLSASAQVTGDSILRSKKGIPILPQKGDWAIGANAAPYLSYLGNIFNNTSGNNLTFNETTLYGRYFLADNTAVRITVSMNNSNTMTKYYVQDDAGILANPNSNAQTIDTRKIVSTNNVVNLAYMKFRGYGRLRGFYGAHVGFGFSRTHTYYTYGNPITVANSNPTSITNWNASPVTVGNPDSRTLENDGGVTRTISAGLLAGVEYFFAPKMCIGTEITLNASHAWKSQGNSISERLNGTAVEELDLATSPKGRTSTSLNTRYASSYGTFSLYLMFHF